MKTIQVQALTAENFARYGEFQNLLDDASLASKSVFPYGFFADVVKLDLGGGNLPTVSVCQVKKQEKNIIASLEAHKATCEGLLPLDDDVVIFVGIAFPGRPFTVDNVEAFYVPKCTFVKLNPYILHGAQFHVNAQTAHIACILPGRTFANDIQMEILPEDGRAEIIM